MLGRYEAIIQDGSDRHIFFEDAVPLKSAELFKYISDKVWENAPVDYEMASWTMDTASDPVTSLASANALVATIDSKLVVAGPASELRLDRRGEEVIFTSDTFANPLGVSLTTFNWDSRFTYRMIKGNKDMAARFTGGHCDYSRELRLSFGFPEGLFIDYAMQRLQERQNKTVLLSTHAWYRGFSEQGYEGTALHDTQLTEAQESELLHLFARIGNISLASTP